MSTNEDCQHQLGELRVGYVTGGNPVVVSVEAVTLKNKRDVFSCADWLQGRQEMGQNRWREFAWRDAVTNQFSSPGAAQRVSINIVNEVEPQ
jgi:hypothetical protein